jgi:hypothetical protein
MLLTKTDPLLMDTEERYRYWKDQVRFLRDCRVWVDEHADRIETRQRYYGDVDPDSIQAVNERVHSVTSDLDHAQRQVAYWHRALYDMTRIHQEV